MPYAVAPDGAGLYYEVHGHGEPLLLIMGLGMSLTSWHLNVPDLAARFQVITFDNRGSGRSDRAAGECTTRRMAGDAAGVLDALALESAHLLGVSMGGLIAQEFALAFPHRVRRLVLACTYAGGPRAVMPEPLVEEAVFRTDYGSFEEALRRTIPFIYAARTIQERGDLIETDIAHRLAYPPSGRGFRQQLDACRAHDAWERLPLIQAPTLVVHGDADLLVPTANGPLIAERLPAAELLLLPEAGHMIFSEAAAAFNEAVISFLERRASRPLPPA